MKTSGRFSKFIVILVILLNIIFTGVVLYAFLKTGNEPAVLEGFWFGFTTGELWLLARIKKAKVAKPKCLDKPEEKMEESS